MRDTGGSGLGERESSSGWRERALSPAPEVRRLALLELIKLWPTQPDRVAETFEDLIVHPQTARDPVWMEQLVQFAGGHLPLDRQEELVGLLETRGDEARAACIPLLWRISVVANRDLESWIEDRCPGVRSRLALELAAHIPAPRALEALLRLARDCQPEVVLAVALAFHDFRQSASSELLLSLELNSDYRRLCELAPAPKLSGEMPRRAGPAWQGWQPGPLTWEALKGLENWSSLEFSQAAELVSEAAWRRVLRALYHLSLPPLERSQLLAARGAIGAEISSLVLQDLEVLCDGYGELLDCFEAASWEAWRRRWAVRQGSREGACGPWYLATGRPRTVVPWWEARWWTLAQIHIGEIAGQEGTNSARTEALP